jgi:hypothetical protein
LKLSIVVVNYNSSDDLAQCLASLREHPPSCPCAVVVVDNASRDAGLAEVRRQHADVRWIMNDDNVGYARGVNQGLAAVGADYALILNPDIVVLPGAIDALLALADTRPKAGIIGPQLLNQDGSIQESCRRFYTLRTLLLRRTVLGRLFPDARSVREHLMRDFDHRSERAVDWVVGGAMLVRRQARERAGLMDERFFLYLEDVDWCYRMWQSGWDVLYTPAARFIHGHRRASARKVFRRAYWSHLGSLISFYEKWGVVVYLVKRWRGPLAVLLLWLLDLTALNLSLLLAYLLRAALDPLFPEALLPLREYRPLFLFASLLVTVTFVLRGRYRHVRLRRGTASSPAAALAGLVALLLLATTYLTHQRVYSRAVLLIFAPVFALSLGAVRTLLTALGARMERDYVSLERTLLVGPSAALAAWLARRGDLRGDGLDPVGFVCEPRPGTPEPPPLQEGRVPWLGGHAEIAATATRYRISQVVFWDAPTADPEAIAVLRALRRLRIRLRWRLADDGLLTGARPEPFAGTSSLVLEPPAGLSLARVLAPLADRAAGLGLLVLSALPYLALRLTRRQTEVATFAWREGGPPLRLIAAAGCRPRRLWWQAPLGWDLVRGRVALAPFAASPAGEAGLWNDLAFAPHQFSEAAGES